MDEARNNLLVQQALTRHLLGQEEHDEWERVTGRLYPFSDEDIWKLAAEIGIPLCDALTPERRGEIIDKARAVFSTKKEEQERKVSAEIQELAQLIADLFRESDSFKDYVQELATEWVNIHEEWKNSVNKYAQNQRKHAEAVHNNERLQIKEAGPLGPGWFWGKTSFPIADAAWEWKSYDCWLPPELTEEPSESPRIPFLPNKNSHDDPFTDVEKAAIVAFTHDLVFKRVNPLVIEETAATIDLKTAIKKITDLCELREIVKTFLLKKSSETECSHNVAFTEAVWYGKTYSFKPGNQAETVRHLWKAWEKKNSSSYLSIAKIKECIGSQSSSKSLVRETFRAGQDKQTGKTLQHPAWGTMIDFESRKGFYRLKPPD